VGFRPSCHWDLVEQGDIGGVGFQGQGQGQGKGWVGLWLLHCYIVITSTLTQPQGIVVYFNKVHPGLGLWGSWWLGEVLWVDGRARGDGQAQRVQILPVGLIMCVDQE
jgi:hypothetical protein